ncbi:DUF521 domain-containing protein [Pseudoflavonifractor sp. AF19-9AC]|uniref:aconitase X catalytic domain-containing protein n=1 Tax=Pseudoflavonifractor sp. AF19-9AC TaxID=2292244 RepID=UPI000E4B00DD|nr:aconitase X catalytic domain-containing protein [Pseudoflavonifractor sp. AF19-9AC]RHR10270.1 DUF521 domain-containing protein [Pseudoflavonifractor sp. AF19-9AC]
MELTAYQQELLDGVWGKGKSMAMQILVGIGKCFDAPRLVPITRAHVSLSAQEADLWFSGKLLAAGASCAVPPTVNPGYSLDYFGGQISEAAVENMRQVDQTYRQLGARMTYSCTPYLGDNVPDCGEIVAFSETNATIFVNSVLGARTNRESAASALCAAVTGFTPEYGMLLEENRFATVAVEVQATLRSDFDYAVLGLMGKKIGKGVPAFLGLPREISTEALIALGTQLNVSGSFDLFHIPGVTAEVRDMQDAFGGRDPQRRVVITDEDLEKALETFSPSPSGPIEYCILGCPHYTLSQLEEVAELLAQKASQVPIYILTSSTVKARARECGLEQRLLDLGAQLIPDTCVDEACCWGYLAGRPGVTDSPKGAYYMETSGIQLAVRDRATCIRWAQNGSVC